MLRHRPHAREARALPRWDGFFYHKFDYAAYPPHLNVSVNAGEYAWKPVIVAEVVERVAGPERSERRAVGRCRLLLPRAPADRRPDQRDGRLVGPPVARRHAGVDPSADVRASRRGRRRVRRQTATPMRRWSGSRSARPPPPPARRCIGISSCRGRRARWSRTASRRPARPARTTGRIRRCCRISSIGPGTRSSTTRRASWPSAASATGGSTTTSGSMSRRGCTPEPVSRDRHVCGHGVDFDLSGDALRAVSRLAQGAGVLPDAARRQPAGAGDVPYVLAPAAGGFWRKARPFGRKQALPVKAFFATQDLSRCSLVLWSDEDLSGNPWLQPFAPHLTFRIYRARGGSARHAARRSAGHLPAAGPPRLAGRRSVPHPGSAQLRRRLRRHGHGAAPQPRRAAGSGVHLSMGRVRRRVQRRADALAAGQRLRARADRRRDGDSAGRVQLGQGEPQARDRTRPGDHRVPLSVLQHRVAGGSPVRAVQEHAQQREPLRGRVRLALAQPVGRADSGGQQVSPARGANRPALRAMGLRTASSAQAKA